MVSLDGLHPGKQILHINNTVLSLYQAQSKASSCCRVAQIKHRRKPPQCPLLNFNALKILAFARIHRCFCLLPASIFDGNTERLKPSGTAFSEANQSRTFIVLSSSIAETLSMLRLMASSRSCRLFHALNDMDCPSDFSLASTEGGGLAKENSLPTKIGACNFSNLFGGEGVPKGCTSVDGAVDFLNTLRGVMSGARGFMGMSKESRLRSFGSRDSKWGRRNWPTRRLTSATVSPEQKESLRVPTTFPFLTRICREI